MKLVLGVLLALSVGAVFGQSMGLALEGEEWSGAKTFPVKGRTGILIKQKLTFGEYATLEVDRSWTRGTSVTRGLSVGTPTDDFYQKIITTDVVDKKQTLYFSLADSAGNVGRAFCMSGFHERDFNIGNSPVSALNILIDLVGKGGESSNVFFVRIYGKEPADAWSLYLDNEEAQRDPKGYVGYLAKSKDEYYQIVPASRIKNKKGKVATMPFGSAGFEIRSAQGEPLAAVSLIDNGVVYLRDLNDDERMVLATACAALLLQQEAL